MGRIVLIPKRDTDLKWKTKAYGSKHRGIYFNP
jgi:hypothetical protein